MAFAFPVEESMVELALRSTAKQMMTRGAPLPVALTQIQDRLFFSGGGFN
jgi:hypothetical protein